MQESLENEFLHENINQERIECTICQRKFYSERIERHIEACEKAKKKENERKKILKKKGLLEKKPEKHAEQEKPCFNNII